MTFGIKITIKSIQRKTLDSIGIITGFILRRLWLQTESSSYKFGLGIAITHVTYEHQFHQPQVEYMRFTQWGTCTMKLAWTYACNYVLGNVVLGLEKELCGRTFQYKYYSWMFLSQTYQHFNVLYQGTTKHFERLLIHAYLQTELWWISNVTNKHRLISKLWLCLNLLTNQFKPLICK